MLKFINNKIFISSFFLLFIIFTAKIVFTAPDLTISVTGSNQVEVGNPNPYTYTVSINNPNTNTVTATNMTIDVQLGTDFNYFATTSLRKNGSNIAFTSNTVSNVTTITPTTSLSVAPNDNIELVFTSKILCNASSLPVTAIARYTGDAGQEQKTSFLNVEVLKGAILLSMTTSALNVSADDVVNLTVKATNSGLGTAYNVNVSDVVGTGFGNITLTPDSTPPTFSQAGNTFTAMYSSIPSGQTRTFVINAKVIGCTNLNNSVTTTWPNGAVCDTDTISGGLSYIPKDPGISYTINGVVPPTSMNLDWGNVTGTPVSVILSNTDPGEAKDFKFVTSLNTQPLTVSNVSSGWSYSSSTGIFTFTGNSPAGSLKQGQSTTLNFTLTPSSVSCSASPTGNFTWKPSYNDICGNLFEPPVSYVTYNTINNPTIDLIKTSSTGGLSELGESFSYSVQLNTTNVSNMSGNISVSDIVPSAFTVTSVSATSGTASNVGQNVTWSLPSSTSNGQILTINVTAPSNACNANASYSNTAVATVNTVRACTISSTNTNPNNDTVNVYLQNYGPGGVSDSKIIDLPASSPYEVCEATTNIRYVNEYIFSGSMTGTFSGSTFKEMLNNSQTFVSGTAEYELVSGTGTPFTGVYTAIPIANITSTSPNLNIDLGFLSGSVTNKKLRIRYKLYATQIGQFNDVSEISINGGTGGCSARYYQAVPVDITNPLFELTINNNSWANTVDDCETKNITLNVNKTGFWDAQNEAKINFDTTNYTYVGNPIYTGFGGLIPTNSQVGSNRVFSFGANPLTTGGTISFDIRKKCGAPATLNADMSWKNRCNNTLTSNSTNTPILNRKGKLALSITPAVISTATEDVSWIINVLNSGDGNAYNVNVNDILGSNLKFVSDTGSILPSGSSFTSQPAPNSTGTITWVIDKITPGKNVTIKVNVKLIGLCGGNTTNSANASYGCDALSCSIASSVNGPNITLLSNNVLNTLAQVSNIKLCGIGKGKLTIKNSGQANSYNLQSLATLPAGMCYVANSAKISKNGGSQSLFEPIVSGQNLTWKFGTSAPNNTLNSLVPLDIAEIEFDVKADCQALTNSRISTETRFAKPCEIDALGGVGTGTTGTAISNISNFDMIFDKPIITSNISPSIIKAEPSQSFTFNYNATNSSTQADAENSVIEITLPNNVSYNSMTTSPTPSSVSGQVLSWNIGTLAKNGGTYPITVGATVNSNGCTVTEQNINAIIRWGCNPANTCSGVSCQNQSSASTSLLRTKPLVQNPTFEPNQMNSCATYDGGYGAGVFRVTFNNDGPSAYNLNVIDTLPTGYVFDASYTPVITMPFGSILNTSPSDGASTPTWNFTKITEGNVDIRFKVKPINSGSCATNTGTNLLDINFDDHSSCTSTSNYSITQLSSSLGILKPVISLASGKSYLNYFSSDSSNIQIISDGQTGVEWEISFRNTGNDTLTNFKVTDLVGASFNSVSALNGSGGEIPNITGNTVTWNISSLAAGATWSARVTANHVGSNNATDLKNTVTIDGGCTTPGCKFQNTIGGGGLPYTEVANASLLNAFSKTMSKTSATIGEQFTTTLTANFSGNGTGAYTNIVIRDTFPRNGANPYIRIIGTPTVNDTAGNAWTYTAPAAGNNWVASWSPTTPATFNTATVVTITMNTYISTITPTAATIVVNAATKDPSSGQILTNNASIDYRYASINYTKTDSKTITVTEPNLSTYDKQRALLTLASDGIDSIPVATTVVGANDIIGYRITIPNTGTSTAHDVRFLDVIFDGMRAAAPTVTRVLLNSVSVPSSQYTSTWNGTTGFWNLEFLKANGFNGIPSGQTLEIYYYTTVDVDVEAIKTMSNVFQLSKTIAGNTLGNEGYSSLPSDDTNNTNDRKYSGTTNKTITVTTPNLGILKAVTTNVTEGNNTLNTRATIGETITYKVIFGTSNITSALFPAGYSTPTGTANNNTTNKGITALIPLSATTSPVSPIAGLPISTFIDVIPDGLDIDQANSSIIVRAGGSTSATPILNYTLNSPTSGRTTVYTNTFNINPNTILEATIVCKVKNTYSSTGAFVTKDQIISNGGATAANYARLAHQRYATTASTGLTTNATLALTSGTSSITIAEPVMSITKTKTSPAGNVVFPGDQVSYTLSVNNSNTTTTSIAHQLVINDIMPLGMRSINPITSTGYSESVAPTVRGYDSATGKLLWIYTSLNANTTRTITYRGTVDSNAPTCTPLVNNAQITSYTSLANGINDSGRKYYPIITAPPVSVYVSNLSIQPNQSVQGKSGDTVVLPHVLTSCTTGTIDFSSLVSSKGWIYTIHEDTSINHDGSSYSAPLTSISVTSNIPKYIVIKTQIPSNIPDNTIDTVKLTISQLVGSQTVTASVNDIVTVTSTPSGLLKLVKVVDKSSAKPGEELTYTITYTNTGNSPLHDIIIEDMTPAGTTFQSAEFVAPSTGSITSPAINAIGKISWSVSGVLNQGESGTVRFKVKIN